MTRATVVAVGPGDGGFLTGKGAGIIAGADVIAGFETVLGTARPHAKPGAEILSMNYPNQEAQLDLAAARAADGKTVVVCAWGDLNVSCNELLDRVRQRIDEVELVPGISCIQIAAARSGIAMEQSLFVTLHRRYGHEEQLDDLIHYLKEARRNVICLPRPFDIMPAALCRQLMEAGIDGARAVTVHQRLTFDDESSADTAIADCAETGDGDYSDLTVMVFPKP